MTIANGTTPHKVIEASWDEVMSGELPPAIPEPPIRQLFRQCVTEIAIRAHEALPASNGRVFSAVRAVLQGDVSLRPDGTADVGSQSEGETTYHVNGACECKDFAKAPSNMCKHRIAFGIMKRATGLVAQRLDAAPTTTPAAPTSQAPGPQIPAHFLVELHGKQFVTFGGLLAMAHHKGLVRLAARFISVNDTLALAEATAEFADGRIFQECADATPKNVNRQVALHFPRCAITRAKARALRDALNISMVAVEELEG